MFGIGFNFGNGAGETPGDFPFWESDTDNNLFTSIEEIQLLFSSFGEQLHTDDLNPLDDNFDTNNAAGVTRNAFLAELIQRATSHIMSYLAPRFSAENLKTIPRIREIATYWACYKLSRRRGNQSVYEEEYMEAMEDLEDFRTGRLFLDAPSNGPRAYMQSYVVDNRYYTQPLRVIAHSSTSTIAGQKLAYRLPFYWL